MEVIDRLASARGRRDDAPNKELARELAERRDEAAIRTLVELLGSGDRSIQSDCIKVLYEVGYLAPELIRPHVGDFLGLLESRNNRLVWGAMIALSTLAVLEAERIFGSIEAVQRAMDGGSVITVDYGVKLLSRLATAGEGYRRAIVPSLLEHLETCRGKDLPRHAEFVSTAISGEERARFRRVLEGRRGELAPSQARRIEKVLRSL